MLACVHASSSFPLCVPELERFLYGVQNNADQMATPEVKDAVEEVLSVQ